MDTVQQPADRSFMSLALIPQPTVNGGGDFKILSLRLNLTPAVREDITKDIGK